MKYDLLPCPFCGSKSAVFHFMRPVVTCGTCEAEGPYPTTTGDEREAAALWNQRLDSEREPDSSHGADAFQYMAAGYQRSEPDGDE